MMRGMPLEHWIMLAVGVGVGVALGAVSAALVALLRRQRMTAELATARSRCDLLDAQAQQLAIDARALQQQRDASDERREAAERETAVLRASLRSEQANLAEQRKLLDDARTNLRDTFLATGGEALAANTRQFIALATTTFQTLMSEARGDVEKKHQAIDAMVKPIRELLEKHQLAVSEIETKRESAYARLDESIRTIAQSHEKLNVETSRLVSALRRPEQRGRWGEIQLRNVVELAGMCAHCDFDEQVTSWNGEQSQRPDMTVRLPGGGEIAVDSKVALDAYLDAIQPDSDRSALLERHARHVQDHVRRLAEKRYWEAFARAPRLVVLFMPVESALTAALESRPDLHAAAMQQHVLIATPTLLVALLRAIAYGWQQEDVAANARQIAETGQELYARIGKFVECFEMVGNKLSSATNAYNAAVGSLDQRLLVSARKLKSLHATTDAELETPTLIDIDPRQIVAADVRLIDDTTDK